MLLQKDIEISICASNIKYWKDKGYVANLGTKITVKTEDLKQNSNYKVLCSCNTCFKKYYQRFSRNKDNCSKCLTSKRMKNNTLGKNNKTITIEKNKLLEDIDNNLSKTQISKKYNTTISIINRHLKEYNLKILPYKGRLFFKTKKEEQLAIEKIKLCTMEMNISEISNHTGIPKHIINMLRKKNKIDLKTQFDVWKIEYEKILSNIEYYKTLNEKLSLKDISQKEDISIEQLKKAFNEKNIKVKLHSYNKSKGELECKEFIRNLGIDCHSIVLNKKYEIDCFAYQHNFGVEYCGEFWHRYIPSKNNKNYHKNKYEFCKTKNNIKLMTIFECEWENKREIVESMIKSRLNKNTKIFARKCEVKEIPSSISNNFHEKNHISGKLNSSINIGLYYNNTLFSVLSFVKSRFDKDYEYEISRYSTKTGFVIVGGLSKMFSYFVKKFNPKSCMTYSDLRFGEGKCYEKIGFSFIGKTPPNYFYFKKNGDELENRMKYQKHKLQNLKGYSPDKTEFEIMTDSDFYRLYDCGNNKYGWTKK